MFKLYSGWISFLSFISLGVLAIVKLITNVPNDVSFIITEWVLLILFFVGSIICIREDKR